MTEAAMDLHAPRGAAAEPVTHPAEPLLAPAQVWAVPPAGRRAPLVVAAGPVLELCAAMKTGASGHQAEQVHRQAFRTIRQFEDRAASLGLAPRILKASKYALCASLDDIAMNTTWGSRSVWTSRTLVGAHFSETWGGDRFFDLLEQMQGDASAHIELLELLYCCLSLGFEGRYRVLPRGASELQLLRDDLYRLIRGVRGASDLSLAVRGHGVEAPQRSETWRNSLALASIGALGALLALTVLLLMLLDPVKTRALTLGAGIPPQGPVTLLRPEPPVIPVSQLDRLRGFLEEEIREGLVTVTEDDRSIKVLIRGDGMFDSAEAVPRPEFGMLLQRIGQALDAEDGQVAIEGHTDSQPIRSADFASNQALSLARAQSVRDVIAAQMARAERLDVIGRGASGPIASNDTAEGRALNRRTEVILFKETP